MLSLHPLVPVPVHGGAAVGAGVVTVGHALLCLDKVAAGTLESKSFVFLLRLHHLRQGQLLRGKRLPDSSHELRVLGHRGKSSLFAENKYSD